MKHLAMLPVVFSIAALVSCQDAANVEEIQTEQLPAAPTDVLPKVDEKNSYLFWAPDEQLIGYRNIEKIFDTRLVRASREARPLTTADRSLNVSYEYEGEHWTEETYMVRNNVVGLLVIKDGEIVLERYRHGYDADQRWISFSVAKSFTSTLVGAAIKDGAIKSLQDPVTDYLPELSGSAYDHVTVRHLLTMTTGAAWNEDYADPSSDVVKIKLEPSVDGSDPVVTYLARLPRDAEPGTRFHYNTGETHLVGSLVRATTGIDLADYLSEKIWIPYGMEHDANWMLTKGHTEYAGCCLSASLRDFGRFGMFFMNGAMIDSVSIVPDGWTEMATATTEVAKSHFELRESPRNGYGFMWWTMDSSAYQAIGIFGQLIHINPELNLVIVTQSAWPTALSGSQVRRPFVRAIETAIRQ